MILVIARSGPVKNRFRVGRGGVREETWTENYDGGVKGIFFFFFFSSSFNGVKILRLEC